MPQPMLRRFLMPLALVALLGLAACGDDDDSGDSGGSDTVAQEQPSGTDTTPSPAEAEEALKDTAERPQLPKPTGSPPRKLVIEDIVKGKGPGAKQGSTVVVNYVGMNFSNGQEFDASWDRGQPFPVQLGTGGVIEGWEKGLIGIKAGGRRKLTIPPELGYGAEGYPPDIPPNETLIFVIDAVTVQ
jgi:peptidylprolyl isomerase